MKWQATITKENNGYSLTLKGGNAEEPVTDVFQERVGIISDGENKEHLVEMLYEVLDHFGECGSKHDKKRIRVEWCGNEE